MSLDFSRIVHKFHFPLSTFFTFQEKAQPRLTTKLRQISTQKNANIKGRLTTLGGFLLREHRRWLLGLLCAFGIYAYELHALVVAEVVGFYHET